MGPQQLTAELVHVEQWSFETSTWTYLVRDQELLSAPVRTLYMPPDSKALATNPLCLKFVTPVRLQEKGTLLQSPSIEQFLKLLMQRIVVIHHMYGLGELQIDTDHIQQASQRIRVKSQDFQWVDIERFSYRKHTKMKIGGLVGEWVWEGEEEELSAVLPYLQLAEWIHVGKHTSFGYGKINVCS
ncbi:CRISPR system precrRNA processing endoribonuclease RAMP protein Cas6 [Paenibacillus chartarius]|uniref:CRISPR system precrRNA processing endoribonuclease RAMP protein Cas6 n=1 Tax=Paenibacillus chartarius TaxID=747481 RepID=A0ABV6DTJ3_9BACL